MAVGLIIMHWRTVEFDPDNDGIEEVPAFTAFVEQRLLLLAGFDFLRAVGGGTASTVKPKCKRPSISAVGFRAA